MRRVIPIISLAALVIATTLHERPLSAAEAYRRISVTQYVDRLTGGWIGQMAGVGFGAPTEFKFQGRIIPEAKLPKWQPEMVNQYNQDDIYVEMTFLRTLEEHGWDVSQRQCGIDFANSRYELWHANKAGRDNLRNGIAPPDSAHPQFNKHADDIDYQIEADYSGLIAPGMPQVVIDLGEKFGGLMNYGDGLYGGQFIGGMYAEAFFETEPEALVKAGLKCIPEGSQYAECIRDVLAWHAESPDDWQATWKKIEAKYHNDPAYRRGSCNQGAHDIDAKLNGAYVVMGLLYGKRYPMDTITIACRCGQDSDCNPSSAGGVLGASLGLLRLPRAFTAELEHDVKFRHTAYDFDGLIKVCTKLAREAVLRSGGHIEKGAMGEEVFVIPVVDPRPSKLEQVFAPGPIANSHFTEEEMKQITPPPPPKAKKPANAK